jgi:hypothetical protein
MSETNAVALYSSLLRNAHEFLEGTVADVTPAQFAWDPPGTAFNIATNYAHALTSEDFGVHRLLLGKDLLAATDWAGAFGAGGVPPLGPGGDLKAWSRTATVDLATLQRYGQAVYAATDRFLASLTPADLDRPLDLSAVGFGQQTWLFILTAVLANVSLHTGEISCLKGQQGGRGYPV